MTRSKPKRWRSLKSGKYPSAAFNPAAGEEVPGGSYYERSQPRIGHLLEEHLAARPPAAGPVRVCTLPQCAPIARGGCATPGE